MAIECREGDAEVAALVAAVDHPLTRAAVQLERAFLAELGSGCSLPVAAHAVDDVLTGFLAAPSAHRHVSGSITVHGSPAQRMALAAGLARSLQADLG